MSTHDAPVVSRISAPRSTPGRHPRPVTAQRMLIDRVGRSGSTAAHTASTTSVIARASSGASPVGWLGSHSV